MKFTITPTTDSDVERQTGPMPKWSKVIAALLERGTDRWHHWHFERPVMQGTVRAGLNRALKRRGLHAKYKVGVRRRVDDYWRERQDVLFVALLTRKDGG